MRKTGAVRTRKVKSSTGQPEGEKLYRSEAPGLQENALKADKQEKIIKTEKTKKNSPKRDKQKGIRRERKRK